MNEQGFHSRYAYDERGGLITYTNNICAYADQRNGQAAGRRNKRSHGRRTPKGHVESAAENDDEALWVPCWTTEFIRLGYCAGSNGRTVQLRNSAIPSYLIPWKVICTGWITISKRKQWKPSGKEKHSRKWIPCMTSTATWTPLKAWITRMAAASCRLCLSSRKAATLWNLLPTEK